MMTALAARYEVMTHDISSMLAANEPCMWGSATLVMLVSSTCITVTSITENVMAHLRPVEMGASATTHPHVGQLSSRGGLTSGARGSAGRCRGGPSGGRARAGTRTR